MILALDIGNTNITMGVYDGKELKFVSRLATDRQRTEDQYAVELRDIVDIYGVSISQIEGSIISSVVPALTSGIKRAIKRLTGTVPLCIGPGMKTGLNIKLNDPSTLGADLVAGAVAAIELFDCPCIIFDIGTATTISVLDSDASPGRASPWRPSPPAPLCFPPSAWRPPKTSSAPPPRTACVPALCSAPPR